MTDTTVSSGRGPVHYVRREQAAVLPPPVSTSGVMGWIRLNLISSPFNIAMTVLAAFILYTIIPPFLNFTVFNAIWSGTDREACLITASRPVVGACWPFVSERFMYFVYGSYPIDQRWRPNLFFILLAISVVWVLWLNAPRRDLGMLFAFVFTPFLSYWLLSGGTPAFALLGVAAVIINAVSSVFGTIGSILGGIPVIGKIIGFPFVAVDWVLSSLTDDTGLKGLQRQMGNRFFFLFDLLVSAGAIVAFILRNRIRYTAEDLRSAIFTVLGVAAVFGLFVSATGVNEGLPTVTTNLWGGILISLIVAAVGIIFSLPFGILLALGRRSNMPAVKLFSVILIEFVRGVPFITVLFMASNMLPLFVPEQYAPDKLMRALIAAAIFASAYMAEVVRAGLQALPKGQYEGAMAMGLGYWQMMRLIVLPQALKITIPNIVNTYIGLFKDTTLVIVVGLFDFLKTIEAARIDPKWAAPTTSATGYMFAAIFYFICCYAMSRYAKATEERLGKADKR
ncbi:MAG: amino acid ABC transporter permease [Beijerinckiaceae bacterium]